MHTDPTHEGLCILDSNLPTSVVFLVIHDKILIAFGDESFKFLTYQLSMVGYWPTMAVTGNRELGFDLEREPEKRLPLLRKAAGE